MLLNSFSFFLPLAADVAVAKENTLYQTLAMLAAAVVFFYFILFRPEQKRKKKLESMRSSMKPGDKVIAMGMRATIDDVKEKTVILRQVDGSKIEMLIGAITEIEQSADK